jgi:hypothetical protein
MTRAELIRKLLETSHLNVPERRQLVPSAVHLSEVLAVIRDVVERENRFCSVIATLEKHEGEKYRIYRLRDPTMGIWYPSLDAALRAPPSRAVPVTDDYPSLDSALQAFVGHVLTDPDPLGTGLAPGTIDGIEILGLPTREQPERCTPAVGAPSDHRIIPGDRIGPVRLAGHIDEVVVLLGPGTQTGPGFWPSSVLQTWDAMGLWVVSDMATGNIFWISIDQSGSEPWTDYVTSEGIHLGSAGRELVSIMGPPERTVTGGGAKSLYYDRRGIRFTIQGRISLLLRGRWPFAQKVGAIRIVWPSVPRGDTLIVAGKRISSIGVRMPIDDILTALGGGYLRGESSPGFHVYYWLHLQLSLVEKTGRTISVRAGAEVAADGACLRYATADGLGLGSTATAVRRAYGEAVETHRAPGCVWWTYRSQGINFAFALDDESRVRLVDVFPPEKGPVKSVRYRP